MLDYIVMHMRKINREIGYLKTKLTGMLAKHARARERIIKAN